jgi:hypothetical protein
LATYLNPIETSGGDISKKNLSKFGN